MNKKRIAFTLIELLVVIAIIGILSGLIVVSMNGVTQKATIAKAQVFSSSLKNALMMNIVGQWTFDDITDYNSETKVVNSGGGVPDSWKDNDGQAYGGPTLSTDCVSGNCLIFDGNDYIDVPYNSNMRPTDRVSFAGWGHRNDWSNAGNTRILSCTETGGYNITIYPGSAEAYVFANTTYTTPNFYTSTPAPGWHYFVGTFDGRRAKTYFDGVLADSHDYGAVYSLVYAYTNSLIIGAEASTGSGAGEGYFVGKIDEIKIYNEAVPTSYIKEQYYSGLYRLYTNGGITKEEYLSRVNELAIK